MYYSDTCFFRVRWYKHITLNKLFAWVRFSYELIFFFATDAIAYSGIDFCIQCLYTILTVGKAHVVSKFQQRITVLLFGRILKNGWYHPQIILWKFSVIDKSHNVELVFKHSSSLVWSWKITTRNYARKSLRNIWFDPNKNMNWMSNRSNTTNLH